MLTGRPDIPTDTTPDIIIGVDNGKLFNEHFKATLKAKSPDGFRECVKPFSLENRQKVAVIYEELRAHGFYPSHISKTGEIIFATRTRNIIIDESPMTGPELREARERIRNSQVAMVGDMPKCEPFDYEAEDGQN